MVRGSCTIGVVKVMVVRVESSGRQFVALTVGTLMANESEHALHESLVAREPPEAPRARVRVGRGQDGWGAAMRPLRGNGGGTALEEGGREGCGDRHGSTTYTKDSVLCTMPSIVDRGEGTRAEKVG